MEYQGNEIYWQDGVCYAAPIRKTLLGTLDKLNTVEATETPDVIKTLANLETDLHDGWPLYILTEGEEGAYILSLYEFDGELPLAEGNGSTVLEAANELLLTVQRTTTLL